MKNNKKLALLLVSLMTFSGCEIYYVNSVDSSSTTSSSTVLESSTISSTTDLGSESTTDSSSVDSSTSSEESSVDSSTSTDSSSVDSSTSSEAPQPTMITNVFSFENKATFTAFENNKKEQVNKKDEFMLRDNKFYQVGDDNSFNFKPQLATISYPSDDFTNYHITYNVDWSYNVTLSIYENNEYTTLTAENEYVESLDADACNIDFSDAAVGKQIKISVSPKNLTNKQMNELETKWTRNYIIEVVDGYNVYSAKELGYINNSTSALPQIGSIAPESAKTVWDRFKEANGLELNYYPSSLIMHTDLSITKNDIPSEYFYSKSEVSESDSDYDRVIGSYKDNASVYYRNLSGNQTFRLEGNFFKLDASQFPTLVRSWNEITPADKIVSHAQLFYFYSNTGNVAEIQNIKLDGNAPRSELESLGGGIIMCKTEGVNFTITNAITIRWYISYHHDYAHYGEQPLYTVNYCRSYDNFTGFVYNWGARILINNSEFIQSGGPAILQDYVPKEKDWVNNVHHISSTIVNNTVIENYVAGNEGWFNMHDAVAIIPSIKALDTFLNPMGKTFLKKGLSGELYMNMICVNKDGGAEGPTSNPDTVGSFVMNDFAFDYGQTDAQFGGFYSVVKSMGAPAFYTNAGGMSFTDGATGLFTPTQQPITYLMDGKVQLMGDAGTMAQGDQIALYYNGMQIVFGYNDYKA